MLNNALRIGLLAFGLGHLAAAAEAQEPILRIVGPWEIGGIEPDQTGYIFSRMQIAETLVTVDEQGRLMPALAETWNVTEDGLTWRYTIRSGVSFHDGTALTSEAAAASLTKAHAGSGILSQAPIESIVADGADVVFRLNRPAASLAAFLANYSTIVLAPASYGADGKVSSIVGTGPYRLTQLTPPLKVELDRNDDWWGGKPDIARAAYLAAPKGETRALMAESGDADLVFSLVPVSVDRLRRNSELDVQVVTIPRTRQLKLNASSPFFDDVRERRALALSIDRVGISTIILRNPELAATQLFPKTLTGWHDPDLAPLTHDPVSARRLLAETGWKPGADGILEQDGQRFSVTLRTFLSWPELPVIATALQAQLREVGVELNVSVGNSSEIVSGHRDGSLHLGLASRNFSLMPDPLGTLLQDYGPQGGDWGAMGWSSAELIDLLDQLNAIADPAARAPLQRRVAEILQGELPTIPVAWAELAAVSNKRITGVKLDPWEISYHLSSIRWAE